MRVGIRLHFDYKLKKISIRTVEIMDKKERIETRKNALNRHLWHDRGVFYIL